MSHLRKELNKIAQKITLSEMQEGAGEDELSLETLFLDGRVKQTTDFFLGLYSKQGLLNILEKFGIMDYFDKLGFDDISVEIDTSDSHTHRQYIYSGSSHPDNVICELVAKKGPLKFDKGILRNYPEINPNFLQIEWLLLQNPRGRFDKLRPRLPGQSHPGLKLGRHFLELMIILSNRLQLDGIINKPHFLHTAFMFTKEFVFVNPENQAIIEVIKRDLLETHSYYTISWAANFNCIENINSKEKFEWQPGFLILPLNKKIIKYFRSREYGKKVAKLSAEYHFQINMEKYRKTMKAHELLTF